ncbi:hypothetical protein [Hyphococcus luteus]|uniref:EthD domain-containing protein n=1 Tax=Hyphococcus luteus TaxID=2058213 RepID=A0A2S7K1T0_9PROT|nr:hypothetical protein [Marinicaulis flavus]PQA86388.1 hypothetical protein CW354_18835 [Marinicaulis flavus]
MDQTVTKCRLQAMVFAVLAMFSAPVSAAPAGPAIKHYILIHLKPGADQLQLDRWYLTYHGPENRRAVKAWQRNYLSYRSYLPPRETEDKVPLQYGRMTEIHFDSLDDFRATRKNSLYGGLSSYTPPPGGWRDNKLFETTTATIPVNPEALPVSKPTPPKETPYVRWIIVFDYPESITVEEGDDWWAQERAPALERLQGVRRFGFYKSASDASPKRRLAEIWFDDMETWKASAADWFPSRAKPAWGDPFDGAAMMLIGENPDIDFVYDSRVIP